jgi:predicted RNase H-like HicB family nuclease
MKPDLPSIIEQLELRVFIEFDEDYGQYVARCIDTGAVAEGATIEEAELLITEVLKNDFRIAMEEESLKSLFHGESPFEAKVGWYESRTADPSSVKKIRLEVSTEPQRRSVQSELRLIGRPRRRSTAA